MFDSFQDVARRYFADGIPDYAGLVSAGMAMCPYWESDGYAAVKETVADWQQGRTATWENDLWCTDFAEATLRAVSIQEILTNNDGYGGISSLIGSPSASWFCSRSPMEIELVFVGGEFARVYGTRIADDLSRFRSEIGANTTFYHPDGLRELRAVVELAANTIA